MVMEQVQTSPTIRLYPPSELNSHRWIADNVVRRHRYTLPDPAVLLLLGAMAPIKVDDLASKVASRLSLHEPAIKGLIESLVEKECLLDSTCTGKDFAHLAEIRREWQASGWDEAAEYHFVTFDYPYVGASGSSEAISQKRMVEYGAIEPDLNRYKRYEGDYFRIPLPQPRSDLLTQAFVFHGAEDSGSVDLDLLSRIITLNIAPLRSVNVGNQGAPLFMRSVPSGGSRHPTEVYFLNLGVEDMPQGWYHCSLDELELILINRDVPSSEMCDALFPICVGRARYSVAGVFVLTAVFERNMYRYREPRTFRTIFMDSGHMIASIQSCLRSLGAITAIEYGVNDVEVESYLGIEYLEEGVVLAMSFGSSQPKEEVSA